MFKKKRTIRNELFEPNYSKRVEQSMASDCVDTVASAGCLGFMVTNLPVGSCQIQTHGYQLDVRLMVTCWMSDSWLPAGCQIHGYQLDMSDSWLPAGCHNHGRNMSSVSVQRSVVKKSLSVL